MPASTIVVLAAVVSAFVAFGATLAWAERQTSNLDLSTAKIPDQPKRRSF
jgi:hypothetical protein